MLGDVVLIRQKRSHTTELQDALAAVEDGQLVNGCLILRCVPAVKEQIAWSMPVYKKDKFSISFAACNKHISLYVDTNVLEIFKSQLSAFTIRKNAVYLPYEKELPIKIIEKIIKQSLEEIT